MTIPGRISDRYELTHALGSGGMSEVHRGRDTRLGREVAVKILRADLAREPDFQERFRREAQNAAALNHPTVVAVYDTGDTETEYGTLPFIVMEYVDGRTLRDIVKAEGAMAEQRAMEIMVDVCAALDFSHRAGIVHRDVKPANVMISAAGAVKVMDFGIARALADGQGMTRTATVIGTAQYLSPEQARGEDVDARSDVYAAGCVLYELLTGQPPFTGESPVSVAYQHVREEPRPPSALRPGISPELNAVVLRSLNKNAANRYQSAGEMRSDLVRVLAGQRPQAPAAMAAAERTAVFGESTEPQGPARHRAEDDDDRRRRGPLVALAGLVLAGVAAVLALVFTDVLGTGAPQATVPDVAGQAPAAAENTLQRAGFDVEAQRVESRRGLDGLVVRTEPDAGTEADRGSVVQLLVGTGPPQVRMPDVVGQSPEQARRQIVEAGLRLSAGPPAQRVVQDEDRVGRVAATRPPAGRPIDRGSPVTLVIGRPPEQVSVVDVVGLGLERARGILESGRLQVSVQRVDSGEPRDQVVAQTPQAGSQAQVASTVTLEVSRGALTMPDLEGSTPQQARQTLQDLGWQGDFETTSIPVTDEDEAGVIQNQNPSEGATLRRDQAVTVMVGQQIGNQDDDGGGGGGSDEGDDDGSLFGPGFPFGVA